jgi:VIT1/CCC1 family predicted Fe2+/Mn2+ transporter
MEKKISVETRIQLVKAQKEEITAYNIYSRLAGQTKNRKNSEVLQQIASDELRHYRLWHSYTNEDVKPNRLKIWRYFWISRILGLTFGLKLMEKEEDKSQTDYTRIAAEFPEALVLAREEEEHENELIGMIEEEHLKYMGSIVLGLNDALIEILGTLAGLTFALQNSKLVALAGTITGIAGALSMASSEYLSSKTEGKTGEAMKSAIFTGIAYVIAVVFLIAPFLILHSPFMALLVALFDSLLIVFLFTFYLSVTNDQPFGKRFTEMAAISTGVGLISFGLGYLARILFGIEV